MMRLGHKLEVLVEKTKDLVMVRKTDLRPGDHLVVKTYNSTYRIYTHEDGSYTVTGGWFDEKGLSPARLNITGCTWGGSVIKMDIVAARGLCLEFSNRVVTSPIQKIWVSPYEQQN
jgi:hypothetical protein